MKLKIIPNINSNRIFINIGKNCQIRLRLPVVEHLQLKKGDYILVGTDPKDGDKPKYLYLIKSQDGVDYKGFKVSNGNGAHHISGKGIVDHFKLEHPKAYPYELYTDEETTAIRILL